jgi:acylglycerol lipase
MPSHLRHLEGSFKNARGQNLSYLALFPASSMPLRGVVLYLHGIGDHSRRYFHLYERLCEAGFGVLAYDLLSHGASDSDQHGLRAHSARFQYFVDDTNEFIDVAKTKLYPQLSVPEGAKMVLAGMSYGTLVSLHTVLSGKHDFSAVCLVAPALLVEMTAILRVQAVFARPLSKLLPKARIVPGVNGDYLCRDPDYVDDFRADPLTVSEPVTARMGAETLKAMRALEADKRVEEKDSALCKLPVLMMMGSNDKVTSLELAQVFYKRLGAEDKEFKVFDGYFHALFDDPEREAVFAHLDEWLKARFPLPAVDKIEEEDEDKAGVKDETVEKADEAVVVAAAREATEVGTQEAKAEVPEPAAESNATSSEEMPDAAESAVENSNNKTAESEEATEPTADVSSEAPKATAESAKEQTQA